MGLITVASHGLLAANSEASSRATSPVSPLLLPYSPLLLLSHGPLIALVWLPAPLPAAAAAAAAHSDTQEHRAPKH